MLKNEVPMHLSNMIEDVLYCKKCYWIKVSSFVLENANVHKIKCKILKDKFRVKHDLYNPLVLL